MKPTERMRKYYAIQSDKSLHVSRRLNDSARIGKDADACILELDERLKRIEELATTSVVVCTPPEEIVRADAKATHWIDEPFNGCGYAGEKEH